MLSVFFIANKSTEHFETMTMSNAVMTGRLLSSVYIRIKCNVTHNTNLGRGLFDSINPLPPPQ